MHVKSSIVHRKPGVQETRSTEKTYVITDIKTVIQYAGFVNSECRKNAIPIFLAYFPIVLFAESFLLYLLGNLWFKLPPTASFIENFVTLVMECYNSPCPSSSLIQALQLSATVNNVNKERSDSEHTLTPDTANQTKEFNIMDDIATVIAVKTLHEKVKRLRRKIESFHKCPNICIWQLYLIQCTLQTGIAFAFFIMDLYLYMKSWPEQINCTISEPHIPVVHECFICSHSLVPTFAGGLIYIYLPALGISFFIFFSIFVRTIISYYGCTCLNVKRRFTYDFDEKKFPETIPAVKGDMGFLLHLLQYSNILYVVSFAHYLSEMEVKKVQAFVLDKKWPVSKLREQLRVNSRILTFENLPVIPRNVFHLGKEIKTLELIQCDPFNNDDFKNISKLTKLRKLSIIQCSLESIPTNILKIKRLEELNLKGNSIPSITKEMLEHQKLKNLTTLDLSDNKIINIESLQGFDNLMNVYLSGNSKLELSALKVILKCEKLQKLEIPEHLENREGGLNERERSKFKDVTNRAGDDDDDDSNDGYGDSSDGVANVLELNR